MAILIPDISLPFDAPPQEAFVRARKLLQTGPDTSCRIVKQSLDARKKRDIRYVYTISVEVENEEAHLARLNHPKARLDKPALLTLPQPTVMPDHPPVVAGFGPAGMFAGLVLAQAGLRPVILELGTDMDRRVKDVEAFWRDGVLRPDSNVQFGEGGAGTFSDGKLTTRIGDSRCRYVLEELHRHGAPEEILYRAKPHVGTDRLRRVVKSIREEILALGGQVLFCTPLTGLDLRHGSLRAVLTPGGPIPTEDLILATGHSARALYPMLLEHGVEMIPKPFSVGVRIEHLQSTIDTALYGSLAGHPALPKGEYQLSHRCGDRAVYTFCMCPGGIVVPAASEEGGLVVNGMSEYARDGDNANCALVVSVSEGDFGSKPLDGVAFQRRFEQAAFHMGGRAYAAPVQDVGSFLAQRPGFASGAVRPSYQRGMTPGDFGRLFPDLISNMLTEGLRRFGQRLPGFDAKDAVLTGVETRTSSPLRILRQENLQAVGLGGLFPCGEGAGYAGGIVSAAVDGIRVAEAVLQRYQA